jgi:hypothetical protein
VGAGLETHLLLSVLCITGMCRCFFLHRPRLELFDRIIYRVEEMVSEASTMTHVLCCAVLRNGGVGSHMQPGTCKHSPRYMS